MANKRGGVRAGSGRPSEVKGGKTFSIRIDKDLEDYFSSLTNRTRVINDLLRKKKEGN